MFAKDDSRFPGEILVDVDAQILDTTVSPVILMASHTLCSVIEYCHAEYEIGH